MEPFFLNGKVGKLFCTYHPPTCPDIGSPSAQNAMLLIPPFAEELNMSRHTFSRLARQFASLGIGVLLLDLYGTGDSEGDFEEVRWQTWRDDVLAGIDWLIERGHDKVDLLGLRLGGLLAIDVAVSQIELIDRIIIWNPITSGRNCVNQFLRFRTLGGVLDDHNESVSVGDLRARFSGGEAIDVIGYRISPELVKDLDALKLAELGVGCDAEVDWFEVIGEGADCLTPGSNRIVTAWRGDGIRVTSHPISDKPFWALPGIEPHWGDGLIAATVDALS